MIQLLFNDILSALFLESDIKHYVSSYRGNSKEYQLKACEDLINDLMKHEDSWPFLRPVSKKMVFFIFFCSCTLRIEPLPPLLCFCFVTI